MYPRALFCCRVSGLRMCHILRPTCTCCFLRMHAISYVCIPARQVSFKQAPRHVGPASKCAVIVCADGSCSSMICKKVPQSVLLAHIRLSHMLLQDGLPSVFVVLVAPGGGNRNIRGFCSGGCAGVVDHCSAESGLLLRLSHTGALTILLR